MDLHLFVTKDCTSPVELHLLKAYGKRQVHCLSNISPWKLFCPFDSLVGVQIRSCPPACALQACKRGAALLIALPLNQDLGSTLLDLPIRGEDICL